MEGNSMPVKATGTMTTREGKTVIDVKVEAFSVMDAIDKVKKAISDEFDFCFEADKWQKVQITIERGA